MSSLNSLGELNSDVEAEEEVEEMEAGDREPLPLPVPARRDVL